MNQESRSSKVQQEIDDNLKRAYGDMSQNVPDRFTDLLAQLRNAEGGAAKDTSENAES